MFTGLVEETGTVRRVEPGESSVRLWVDARVTAKGARLGDSIAVNGCCLTVVAQRAIRGGGTKGGGAGSCLAFDLLQETWDRTNLSAVKPGSAVNLERSSRRRPPRRTLCHRAHRWHRENPHLGASRTGSHS